MSLVRVSLFLYLISTMITITGVIYASAYKSNDEVSTILGQNQAVKEWLEKLNLKYNSTSTFNSTSDFGDFAAGLSIFLGIISGNSLASILTFLPEWIVLIIRIIYIVLTVSGIASWIANRWI